jgi:adenylate/nucleoside-diphosphate kinase
MLFSILHSSSGFILEGFPRNELEARYLANSGYFPDAVILMAVEDTEIVNRLIPPLLEKWKKKRDKRLAEKERLKVLARKQKVEYPC